MDRTEILERVQSKFGDLITDVDLEGIDPRFSVAASDWLEIAGFLRNECELNYLVCLTSIDRGDGLEALYHMEHLGEKRETLAVCIKVSYETPEIPSVETVWRTADWHEREAFDLMGLHFTGHHNLKRILCAEDWVGHPLRKDYEFPTVYHGISCE